jgi:nitrite reductase/ring-hydroxylating ferredoxin subunit
LEDGVNGTAPGENATPVDADGYAEACDASTVPEGAGVGATVLGRELALFRVGDEIRAIDATCPHAGGSLADGSVADGVVTCPLHQWKFDVSTGAGLAPATSCVASYPTRVRDGKVFVNLGVKSS